MINLAGNPDCDVIIRRELERARIPVIESCAPCGREVNARLTGKLGVFTFDRAWYYWVVSGPVPLAVAEELYADPVGKTDIRVSGHCGCPPPKHPRVKHFDAQGNELISDPDGGQARSWDVCSKTSFWLREQPRPRFVPNAADFAARSFVDLYHIDSEIGLRLFADTLRKHGLVPEQT